ncbi:FixH family protein [Ammoniphilus sp. YIM 78166]|uniref:FixH family protein n=1 Tax=Ammoniphilus sp. YIM 78166 TaxID=1644106 RepID=UPI00106FF09E|nr:FixH family protein [Ammoniphilus sp. YIM 78166]
MKISKFIFLPFILVFFLTACSLNSLDEEAVNYFKKETPLQVDLIVSQPITLNETQTIKAILMQNGETVAGLNDVQFILWKKDSLGSQQAINASNDGNGEYSVEKIFTEQGVFYVKVLATSKGSTVMPTKQFIVGELSEEELKEFQKESLIPQHNHDDHH